MTRRKSGELKGQLEARDLQGMKFFKSIRPLLASLHEIGTERDRAGNRDQHMDEYCVHTPRQIVRTGHTVR
ncbi:MULTISPECIES: hypothetical protein [Pirellulaceae]|uniref:hypothetical protein n=1 Tax=Pirellulaceae TaxID=2691357 RepID=UPI0011B0E0DF|nr:MULTISPECIES: hypothetical protein [Pirellulaceae]